MSIFCSRGTPPSPPEVNGFAPHAQRINYWRPRFGEASLSPAELGAGSEAWGLGFGVQGSATSTMWLPHSERRRIGLRLLCHSTRGVEAFVSLNSRLGSEKEEEDNVGALGAWAAYLDHGLHAPRPLFCVCLISLVPPPLRGCRVQGQMHLGLIINIGSFCDGEMR